MFQGNIENNRAISGQLVEFKSWMQSEKEWKPYKYHCQPRLMEGILKAVPP